MEVGENQAALSEKDSIAGRQVQIRVQLPESQAWSHHEQNPCLPPAPAASSRLSVTVRGVGAQIFQALTLVSKGWEDGSDG